MPILRPTIYVSEFVVESEETGQIRIGRGITRRLIIGLTRFKDLAVVGSDCPDGDSETNDIAILRAERGVDFLLSGAIGGTKDLSEHRSFAARYPYRPVRLVGLLRS